MRLLETVVAASEKKNSSNSSTTIIDRGDFLVWGLTAGIAVEVAEAALGRPPVSFEVTPPRAAPYSCICCFRDRNGGMPTTAVVDEEETTVTKKRKP